ncbi:hypothetical protein F5141DRAFT_1094343, partial [Pisolithus sp. B1]
ILSILFRASFLSNITRRTIASPSPSDFECVGEAERRIWAELKYRDDRPALSHMNLISMPGRRVFNMRICSGRKAQRVRLWERLWWFERRRGMSDWTLGRQCRWAFQEK